LLAAAVDSSSDQVANTVVNVCQAVSSTVTCSSTQVSGRTARCRKKNVHWPRVNCGKMQTYLKRHLLAKHKHKPEFIETAVKHRKKIYSLDKYCDITTQSASRLRPVLSRMADKMCNIQQSPRILGLTKRDVDVNGSKVQLRDRVKWIKFTSNC